ncbi:hypothetical protein OUZ56_018136 [Daphnia magna]|uniref:Uncharacterized protein n=1 Tax=Daphnia magna TaxID=35525 RepID=A0ABQ9Z8A2_9CRUS|nr:hypothetical protein OUZ56_018136 [Daphnia magna]
MNTYTPQQAKKWPIKKKDKPKQDHFTGQLTLPRRHPYHPSNGTPEFLPGPSVHEPQVLYPMVRGVGSASPPPPAHQILQYLPSWGPGHLTPATLHYPILGFGPGDHETR